MKKSSLIICILIVFRLTAFADEGMWIPLFLKQLNESTMKERGMKISAEDIYSVNKSSMKDAVVLFGGGCTGEIISNQGLLLTNHHCGLFQIKSLSTIEHDYLKNGFWAQSNEQELACPGLTVTFIVRIEDVTASITKELTSYMTEDERNLKIKEVAAKLEKAATEGTQYNAITKPFFNGNQFFMMVQETFKDVRMVGAPPFAIGQFGGDTDNWMWPRHNADFALFRIYAGKDNKPADYSKENIPYTPKYSFPISLKGIQQGDFTMVMGFPGTTTEYLPSYAVKNIVEVTDPSRIKIRTAKLEIIDAAIRSSDKIRIQYAKKQSNIANAWKKWQGELKGLDRLNTISVKQQQEKAFSEWVQKNNKSSYNNLLSDFEKNYRDYAPLSYTIDYINEAAFGVEILKYATAFNKLSTLASEKQKDDKAISEEAAKMLKGVNEFFNEYDVATDKKMFIAMMNLYYNDVEKINHPKLLDEMHTKYKGDFSKYADDLFINSVFADSVKAKAFLSGFNSKSAKKLLNDPAYQLAISFREIYLNKIAPISTGISNKLILLNRTYMAAQMEMQTDKKFYPDANLTLRVAYGQVEGYNPRDAVSYNYYSTLTGTMEKEDASVDEFNVPKKLKELFEKKDFGEYAVNGQLPVAFVASNHTTGGNSGSPVLNANGELIGTNFDRVWEGTMSDIAFDPSQCRNISLDIRYTLFVIDKYAGCRRLIEEMKIVR